MSWLLAVTLATVAICVTGMPAQNDVCEDCIGHICDFNGVADVVFAVDISGSMKHYGRYEAEKSFVKKVISKLDLGDDKVKTAGVPFNRRIRPGWSFQDSASTNSAEICNAIDSFSRARGDTHTEAGITKALKYFDNHGRADACPVLVLITGGGSDNGLQLFQASTRLVASGAKVCLVPIGSSNANKESEFEMLIVGTGEKIPNDSGDLNDLSSMVDETVACISRCSIQTSTPAPQIRESAGCDGTSFFLGAQEASLTYGNNSIIDSDGYLQPVPGVGGFGAVGAVWNTKDKIIFSMANLVDGGSLYSYDLSNGNVSEFASLGDTYFHTALACDGEHVFVVSHLGYTKVTDISVMGLEGEDPKVLTSGIGGLELGMVADPVQKKLYYTNYRRTTMSTVNYMALDSVPPPIERNLTITYPTGLFFDPIERQLYLLDVFSGIYQSSVDVDPYAFEIIVSRAGVVYALNLVLCGEYIYDVQGLKGNLYKLPKPSEGEVVDPSNRTVIDVKPQTSFELIYALAQYPSNWNADNNL